jgi:Protein of unknown function (DUF3302)
MDSSLGVFDAIAFFVIAVLIFVAVIIVVNWGQLPGQLARKWGHPQASAINAMSWIGIATGGLLWPIAFIWAFTSPFGTKSTTINADGQTRSAVESDAAAMRGASLRKTSSDKEPRS